VDPVTVYRWVLRFTPLLADVARLCRHAVGDRWQVDETDVKGAGRRRYVYRASDQLGPVIDVFVSSRPRRHRSPTVLPAGHRHNSDGSGRGRDRPSGGLPAVLEELLPGAWHRAEQGADHRVEAGHGRLKTRLRPMRGLKQDRSARVVIAGHAFVQNLRRGHHELAVKEPVNRRLAVAFDELAVAI
jgi:IS6 family transposase